MSVFERLKDENIIISKQEVFSKILREKKNHYRAEDTLDFIHSLTDDYEIDDCDEETEDFHEFQDDIADLKDELKDWEELRGEMELNEWIDFLLTSIGYNPKKLLFFEKLFILIRLLPFCNNSYHIIELGPPATGKSYIYNGLSKDSVIKTDNITIPDLFGEVPGIKKNPRAGLLNEFNVVALDEIAERDTVASEVATKLRSFMTDQNASRDGKVKLSNTSLVFLGNLQEEQKSLYTQGNNDIDLFKYFPNAFRKDPFKDRLAFVIPGWHIRNNDRGQSCAEGYGANIHYLFYILKNLRKKILDINIESVQGESIRGSNQVRLTIEGLLKLLYPNDKYENNEIDALKDIARFGRSFLRNSIGQIDLSNELSLFSLEANISFIDNLTIDDVEISYCDFNRLYIKPKNEDILYKVALTKDGLIFNEKECKHYSSLKSDYNQSARHFLAVSKDSAWKNFEVIQQVYKPAKNKKNCMKSLSNYDVDTKLLNEIPNEKYAKIFKLQEKSIHHLKNEINSLKKKLAKKDSELDSLKTDIETYMREVKLEILDIKSWIEQDSPVNFFDEKAGFLSLKNKGNTETDIIKISKELGFNNMITSSDYHLNKESGIKIINFGHLI